MQVKARQYVHLSLVDDVENPVREASHHGTAQITVDSLIERWIGPEMFFDASEFIEKLDPKSPSLFLVGREGVVDLCLGRWLVKNGSCRHRG